MSILSLLLKVGYDGSKVSAGLNSMEKEVQQKAERMQQRITNKLTKAFVIGGTVGLVHHMFGEAKEWQEMAAANDITIAQLSRLKTLADEAGKSFDDFKASVISTGESLENFTSRQEIKGGDVAIEATANTLNKGRSKLSTSMMMSIPMLNLASLAFMKTGQDETAKPLQSSVMAMKHLMDENKIRAENARQSGGLDTRFMSLRGRDFETEHKANLLTRSNIAPQVNSLQQVGLMGVAQNTTVSTIKESIMVLRHIDGTLERIDQRAGLKAADVEFLGP